MEFFMDKSNMLVFKQDIIDGETHQHGRLAGWDDALELSHKYQTMSGYREALQKLVDEAKGA